MVFAKTTLIKEYPMCHYQHLTLIERGKVIFFRAQGKNLSAIVKELGRSTSQEMSSTQKAGQS